MLETNRQTLFKFDNGVFCQHNWLILVASKWHIPFYPFNSRKLNLDWDEVIPQYLNTILIQFKIPITSNCMAFPTQANMHMVHVYNCGPQIIWVTRLSNWYAPNQGWPHLTTSCCHNWNYVQLQIFVLQIFCHLICFLVI